MNVKFMESYAYIILYKMMTRMVLYYKNLVPKIIFVNTVCSKEYVYFQSRIIFISFLLCDLHLFQWADLLSSVSMIILFPMKH